ncbi:unnamed protein product [Toxocara canis]|uniref:Uncharacterized protein n=1 Tax=Toxocara canis TaxID=6265 RepID=A0A183U2S7_TOXCA|nr:unnamed protein product [Toxocara canis]
MKNKICEVRYRKQAQKYKRGTEDSALAYGAARVPGRSAVEIQELVEAIREAIRNEKRNHVVAQTRAWINKPVGPMPTTSSEVSCSVFFAYFVVSVHLFEINSWSQAVQAVQTRKRKVQDCTRQAMARLLWHEVSCRPASETTRRLLPVTDSDKHPGSAVHEVVDFCRLYRFLHSCVSQGTIRELKSLEAAILLSILNEIQEEVDSPEHENKRRVLAGIFRDIQEGKLSDYDFHCVEGWDNIRSVQLDPLNLFSRTRNIFEDDSAANDDPSAHSRQ